MAEVNVEKERSGSVNTYTVVGHKYFSCDRSKGCNVLAFSLCIETFPLYVQQGKHFSILQFVVAYQDKYARISI